MQRYPIVLFFRYDAYKDVNAVLEQNKERLNCDVRIVSARDELVKLFDPNFNILVTYGSKDDEYNRRRSISLRTGRFRRIVSLSTRSSVL